VLQQLASMNQQLSRQLFDEKGQLRNFVNVYVNEEDVRYLQREATPLKDGDTIYIVPSIAGGSSDIASFSYEDVQR